MVRKDNDPILQELIGVVGEDNATNDPVICAAYCFDQHLPAYELRPTLDPRHYYRMPLYVVLPGSAEEVQKIVLIARDHKLPIFVRSSSTNVKGLTIPTRPGIVLDVIRMNKIIEIDEDNMTATVEPGVSFAQLNTELMKRGMFVSNPGAPSTVGVISNYIWCGGKGRADRVGRDYIVGYQIVLPNGLIVDMNYDRHSGKAFWPHGPGPNLQWFPHSVAGAYGVVTKATVRCWPFEREWEQIKVFRVAFDDLEPMVKFSIAVEQQELYQDFLAYGGPIYSCYATDVVESMHRINRAKPMFMAHLLLNGSARKVDYQEKVARRLAEKYSGRIITDFIPPFSSFDEAHLSMVAGVFSETTMKYWSPRANYAGFYSNVGFDPAPQERFIEGIKQQFKWMIEDPEIGKLDFGHDPYFWFWIMAGYGFGAHGGGVTEMHIALHAGDPKSWAAILRWRRGLERLIEKPKVGYSTPSPAPVTRWGIDEERVGRDTYWRMTRRFKQLIDPDNIMAPGYIFIY